MAHTLIGIIPALICAAYGICILCVDSGSGFFLVWFLLAAGILLQTFLPALAEASSAWIHAARILLRLFWILFAVVVGITWLLIGTQFSAKGATLKSLLTNRALLGMIVSAVLLLLASLMGQGINVYLFADYFKNTSALSIFSLLMLPCVILMAMFSTKLATRFGKKECGVAGMAASAVLYLIMGILHIQNVWVFVVGAFFAMLGMYFFQTQCWALVTDVIDDVEVQTGSRDDGTIYGIYSFSRKIGQAIAGGLSGWALGWIGYDSLAAGQTQEVANGIYNLSTFFPALIYLLCALALQFIYPLSKKRVDSNVAELQKRANAQKNA